MSEHTISLQEAKGLEALLQDLEIQCAVQWRMLNDGEILGKHHEAVNLAFQNVLETPYFGIERLRIFFRRQGKKFWKTCPNEYETSKEKWWIGDWVIDLICYRTVETVTTKWDLETTETSAVF